MPSRVAIAAFPKRKSAAKGDFWPDAADRLNGRRVLHPKQDRLADHVFLNHTTGELAPLSPTGRFHIELLRLNRPALVAHRIQIRLRDLLTEKQLALERQNAQLSDNLRLKDEYIRQLRRALGINHE